MKKGTLERFSVDAIKAAVTDSDLQTARNIVGVCYRIGCGRFRKGFEAHEKRRAMQISYSAGKIDRLYGFC